MSHSAAFAENKNEMLSYGVSSIAPAPNGYGVNGTPEIVTAANDEVTRTVGINVASGVSNIMPAAVAPLNIKADNDVLDRSNLAGATLTDPQQTGMRCDSGGDLNYGVKQCANLISQATVELFGAFKDKSQDNTFENAGMQQMKPQPPSPFGGIF